MTERMTLPVLPLREMVLFPGVTHRSAPVARDIAGDRSGAEDGAAPDIRGCPAENLEQVNPENLYSVGTVARIGQMQRGLAGVQLLLQGEYRASAASSQRARRLPRAVVIEAEDQAPLDPNDAGVSRALQGSTRTRSGARAEERVAGGDGAAGAGRRSRMSAGRRHGGGLPRAPDPGAAGAAGDAGRRGALRRVLRSRPAGKLA